MTEPEPTYDIDYPTLTIDYQIALVVLELSKLNRQYDDLCKQRQAIIRKAQNDNDNR